MHRARRDRYAAFTMLILLAIQVILAASSTILHRANPPEQLSEYVEPMLVGNTLTDNGDGTWTVVYWDDPLGDGTLVDTWLDASAPTTNFHDSDKLNVGNIAASGRRCAIFSLDIQRAGFWTNATIINATLEVKVTQLTGNPELSAWMVYRHNWQPEFTTWNQWDMGANWQSSGALGNDDSGGLMDTRSSMSNQSWQTFDITRSVNLAQYRWMNSFDARAGVLLTGAAFGDHHVELYSSDAMWYDQRPRYNITFSWGTPPQPTTSPQWLDIAPKAPFVLDADSQVTFSGQVHNGRGSEVSSSISWTVNKGVIDFGGLYTPSQSGMVDITASASSINSMMSFEVFPGFPVGIEAAPTQADITIDDVLQISAYGIDQHGNPIPTLPMMWSATSGIITPSGNYTPTQIGQHQVTASWGSHIVTVDVNVSEGAPYHIIVPPGLTVPAGEGIQLVPTLTDRQGNILPLERAAGIDWEAESGFVDSAGFFMGEEMGVWQLNATSGSGASGTGWITVTVGTLAYLEIVDPGRNISANEAVPLPVNWTDYIGNNVEVVIPLENWSADDGTFRMGDGVVEWVPRLTGAWTISVHTGGVSSSVILNVTHGATDRVSIDVGSTTISADEIISLQLFAVDIRGNSWPISATWSALDAENIDSLIIDGDGISFEAGIAGNWTVKADHSGPDGDFSTTISIEVIPGRLAKITIAGQAEEISADDAFDFAPQLEDSDGNIIEGVLLNWTIDGEDRTYDLRRTNGVWNPTDTGDHIVEADAAGRSARINIHVTQGAPYRIAIEAGNGHTGNLRSGESLELQTFAEDIDGNRMPWPVEWYVQDGAPEIRETAWTATYLIIGRSEGIWTLEASNGSAWGEFTIQVVTGAPWSLQVSTVEGRGLQGERIAMTVRMLDYGGNHLNMQLNQVKFTTEVGRVQHDEGDHWWLMMDNPGPSQIVVIEYDGHYAETFVDVEPTGFSKVTGTVVGRVLLGGFGISALFILLLLLIVRRNKSPQDHWEEEYVTLHDHSGLVEQSLVGADFGGVSTQNQPMSRRARRRLSMERARERERSKVVIMAASKPPPPSSGKNPPVITPPSEPAPEVSSKVAAQSNEAVGPQASVAAQAGGVSQPMAATEVVVTSPLSKGVLQAMSGTVQGKTGWYQDSKGNASYWNIGGDGSWTKVK
jgi:hypothetical protein